MMYIQYDRIVVNNCMRVHVTAIEGFQNVPAKYKNTPGAVWQEGDQLLYRTQAGKSALLMSVGYTYKRIYFAEKLRFIDKAKSIYLQEDYTELDDWAAEKLVYKWEV